MVTDKQKKSLFITVTDLDNSTWVINKKEIVSAGSALGSNTRQRHENYFLCHCSTYDIDCFCSNNVSSIHESNASKTCSSDNESRQLPITESISDRPPNNWTQKYIFLAKINSGVLRLWRTHNKGFAARLA